MIQVEIRIDETCREPRVVIYTREVTPEINDLVQTLRDVPAGSLIGYQEDRLSLLPLETIIRVYAEQQKVFAQTDEGTFLLRLRLYEVEEKLYPAYFVRISNAEIVNFRRVKNLDLSLAGTICLYFSTGGKSFVSRRFVARIKTYLGL